MVMVQRVIEYTDVGIAQRETQLGADLEVVGKQARAGRHPRAHRVDFVRQFIPAGEIRGIPLAGRSAFAQGRRRHRGVVAEAGEQTRHRQRPCGAAPWRRPSRQRQRRQRQQGEIGRQRPVETHALAVGEKTQREESGQHLQPGPRQITHARRRIRATLRDASAQHREQQQRSDHQRLHRDEQQAIGMKHPGMPFDELETQAGIGVVEVPQQQRQPCQRAQRHRQPHARVAQRAATFRQHQHRHETDADHRDEAIVRESADDQPRREHRDRRPRRTAHQPAARIQAQHRSQGQGHVRQRQHPERAEQRQQHRQRAGLPRMRRSGFAPRDGDDPPRQQRCDQQERPAQTQRTVAADFDAQSRQPCGESGQIRIRPRQMAAFLPVERFVHEQRQAHGKHALDQRRRCPERDERSFRRIRLLFQCVVSLHCRKMLAKPSENPVTPALEPRTC